MKLRKNLFLSRETVEQGQRQAAAAGIKLSRLVEKRLLAGAASEGAGADYWPKPGKPINRPGDARFEYLKAKHA